MWRRVLTKGKTIEAYDYEVGNKIRGRAIHYCALLVQIILQWTWAALFFVDPYYAQAPVLPHSIFASTKFCRNLVHPNLMVYTTAKPLGREGTGGHSARHP